jgi:hypothetical protein
VIRTQISLTEDQQDALRRLAARRGVSQATIIREALDQILDREDRARGLQRALKVAGRFRSDVDDGRNVVRDHDEIYAELLLEDHAGR